jgi:hypothetical protein
MGAGRQAFKVMFALCIALSFLLSGECEADDGQPVAIRLWPDGGMTIETMWGLHIGFGLSETANKKLPRPVDSNVESEFSGKRWAVSRAPNSSEIVTVGQGPIGDDDTESKFEAIKAQANSVVFEKLTADIARVDGVEVVYLNNVTEKEVLEKFLAFKSVEADLQDSNGTIDSRHIVIVANHERFDEDFYKKIAEQVKPELLVVREGIDRVGDQKVVNFSHNTIAIRGSGKRDDKTRFVSLGTEPYKMSSELADLFQRKEAACKDSREVFAKLSIEQMNFKPANGSHTPRWNAEHMMGRELLFFSQIYNAVDPSISVMDLNPKQMPEDYKFAHEDWNGEEEARQMKRVEDFTRRFAYLLDGMPLNRKAKGSRFWSPQALLAQMERHYNEHTANVVKKMELDGWPK